ncbi:MAG TPA: hypothetical protein VEY13_04365, partial [Rubrobacteraceae bacterium]|nr:hypothetical protein [Rubrobacteraceae bacterium]
GAPLRPLPEGCFETLAAQQLYDRRLQPKPVLSWTVLEALQASSEPAWAQPPSSHAENIIVCASTFVERAFGGRL